MKAQVSNWSECSNARWTAHRLGSLVCDHAARKEDEMENLEWITKHTYCGERSLMSKSGFNID